MKGKCKTVLVRSTGRGDKWTPLRTWPSFLFARSLSPSFFQISQNDVRQVPHSPRLLVVADGPPLHELSEF